MTISMVIPHLMRDPEKIIKNNGFPHSRIGVNLRIYPSFWPWIGQHPVTGMFIALRCAGTGSRGQAAG